MSGWTEKQRRQIDTATKRVFAAIAEARKPWDDLREVWVQKAIARWGAGWMHKRRARAFVSAPTYWVRSRFFREQRRLYKELHATIDSILDGTYIDTADADSHLDTVIDVTHWRRKGIWRVAATGTWPSWCSEINIALWPNKTQRFVLKGCRHRKGKPMLVRLNGREVRFEPYPGSRWVRHRSITSEGELRQWMPEAV